ncbi:MAG TPA: exo-alpha-sialidase [Pirellulales bacterium]|nr:exo-alpha-sialidase [Pirellulales bacterium]
MRHGIEGRTLRPQKRPLKRCVFEVLEPRCLLALTVTNVNDSGPGSLRQAILDANGLAGSTQTITFAVPSGPQTIDLLSPLPTSTIPLVVQLDATQNVTVDSPSGGDQNNLGALTKIGAGTFTVSGANNLTGNLQVDDGSLRLDAAGTPVGSSQPFGPVQGVDGEPLAELWPYGGMVPNGNAFARGPVLFTTQAGTVLAMAGYQASSQDSTGNNDIFVRRSMDNGETFGAASIITPPQLAGDAARLASWGGTSWIVGSPDIVQRQDGTIYLFYFQTRNGGVQAVDQRQYVYRYMTSKDDGQTWSKPIDITPTTYFAGNQNVASITSVSDPNPGIVRLGLTFKTSIGSLPYARALVTITGLANDPMGLNGHSYWLSKVISNNTGGAAVVELAGTPAWQDGTTLNPSSIVTPQSVWLGTVGGGEPILRSNRIVIPLYYRYDTGGSGVEPFVGCIYSDDGVTFSQGKLTDETQAAVFGGGGQTAGLLEPHFTELTADNHLYISCNTKGSFHGHMTSTNGGQTWTAGLDDGTNGSTMLKAASTPAQVVALGGGVYVMVMPNNANRVRLTAFLSTDECVTWSKEIPLFTGTAWYSDLCLAGGNILCAYERGHTDTDFNWQGIPGATIGQIGLVRFNLAALMAGITEQVVYDFNELPAGENAWSGSASIVDYGTGDHRATTTGKPIYTAAPLGNGQSALTFHNGDYLLLANQVDPTFDPDYLTTDSGDVTFEFDYTIASHGYGVLLGGNSGVGTGTKGIVVVVNPNGTVSMTVDDGTHHAAITSTIDATNDGVYHRVVCQRDTATGRLRMWTYRSDGSLTETVTSVVDPTTVAPDSLLNSTDPVYLCRYGNTTAGSMTQNITFDLFRYTKKALAIGNFAPIPSVAPAPEQFPAPGATTPDTVAPSNLKLWLLDSRGGYSVRTNRGSSPTPTSAPIGYGADYLLDGSGHGYFTSYAAIPFWRGVDPSVGDYWTVPGSLVPTSLDNGTIGQFDFISRFSSAWTIAGMFRFPSANIATGQIVLSNIDGSGRGFTLGTSYVGTRRFFLNVGNERGSFVSQVTYTIGNGQYSADTWYYFAIEFNGNGGTGNNGSQGLSAYLIPLTGGPLALSDVTGNKSANLASGVITGNTTAAAIGSTAALTIAGGANSESLVSNLCVWNTALTDANILALANNTAGKLTATIDGSGTLVLTGPDSPMAGGSGGLNILNTSSAAAGLLVSGTNQIVGGVDGTGNLVVSAGGSLTANHIIQGALVIGGTAANSARVTIAASDTSGNPLVAATTVSADPVNGGATAFAPPSIPLLYQSMVDGMGATARLTDTETSGPSAGTLGSQADHGAAGIALAYAPVEEMIGQYPTPKPDFSPSGPAPNSGPLVSPLSNAIFSVHRESAGFFVADDAGTSRSLGYAAALDTILAETDSWLTADDSALGLLAEAMRRRQFALHPFDIRSDRR